MDRSIRRLGLFLMVLFCALFAQLNYIQVFRADDLNGRVTNARPILQSFNEDRGMIVTDDGVVLARSEPTDGRFDLQRVYPEADRFASITGYFSYVRGATGLERAYNEELAGRTVRQQVQSFVDLFAENDRSGNLELSVRADVQQAAIDALGGQEGSVVALDPRSGRVLALWDYPSYDPNLLADHDVEASENAYALLEAAEGDPLLPRAYREIYPPGSTFKVVTGATGVETGMVTPTEPVYDTITALDVPQTDRDLPNYDGLPCGGNLFEILAKSCNTSFAQMGLDLGPEAMIAGAEAFGFNDAPPFDLPAVDSRFPTDFTDNQPALAQASIGQNDVAATPLEMAMVAAAVANGGVAMAPRLVDEIRDGEGDLVERFDDTVWRQVISPQTADIMRQAMVGVVTDGTAARLQIDGVEVGAKTGTAQFGSGEPLQSHAWVIAWAGPQGQQPSVAVAVIVLGQPGASEQTGGRVAAPIAREVIEAALQPVPEAPVAPEDGTTTEGGG
ncbi:MAG: hypothetical protein KDA97_00800 [Acidimicrobiales bacterium]|nr:hypothetical protein [Acidimicrobiales bacterium]